ncbi:hypothetical protein E2C01_067880 [Portunus trituberculatus]|uniref:Uncharacterized protein n=1 Tax=Portunus trituberculatus TaxID=210409 RepID=A0A5B7HWC5_PORTR|nr:hypothetical protein [Portunus trituberculatus]
MRAIGSSEKVEMEGQGYGIYDNLRRALEGRKERRCVERQPQLRGSGVRCDKVRVQIKGQRAEETRSLGGKVKLKGSRG